MPSIARPGDGDQEGLRARYTHHLQEAYSKSILERFGMTDCKPTSTPGYGPELSNNQPEDTLLDEEETRRYQGIVWCLMYIAQVLRYDIMYATSQLARPMAKPSKKTHGGC